MFRIRRIFDDNIQVDREAIIQIQAILRNQFPDLPESDVEKLPEQLRNPLKFQFRPILFVIDTPKGLVKAFALMLHAPNLNFCYLDFISTATRKTGRGLGGILYERVREEARNLKAKGLFFECLPDDPKISRNPVIRKQNVARLQFYERFGARPIANTAYETPLVTGGDDPPYLVFDGLDSKQLLSRDYTRLVVRCILERKYGDVCPPEYVQMVVDSFKDDPVQLREFRYVKQSQPVTVLIPGIPGDQKIVLILNDEHTIHHVHERGYVESPVRIRSILEELDKTGLFDKFDKKNYGEKYIREVHDSAYIDYFKKVCENLEPGQAVYPYVFPIRNTARPPKILSVRAGYYCIDTFTPLNRNAYNAARGAVDATLTAAAVLLKGNRLAYALVRPPGHHAERKSFGGFCYFNSNAIAANFLSKFGKVAILDLDFHHGNGQQEIFYDRSDVLTISIHGHPRFAYPYFSGFTDETGTLAGTGFNVNLPLGEQIDGEQYRKHLTQALRKISRFQPTFLVVALGLDTAKGDPTGSWSLKPKDFLLNGELIGNLQLRTLVVQEGGYNNRILGTNARHFFSGLWQRTFSS